MKINGKTCDFGELSFLDLLAKLGLKIEHIALELNGRIVPRADFDGLFLRADDELELVSFVGGG